jgi:hypothetical protein
MNWNYKEHLTVSDAIMINNFFEHSAETYGDIDVVDTTFTLDLLSEECGMFEIEFIQREAQKYWLEHHESLPVC